EQALAWFTSFLQDRSFQVLDRSFLSNKLQCRCGVPQGSALSPTLFNIYMAPLASLVESFGLALVSYADDTQLVVSFSANETSEGAAFLTCMQAVSSWMTQSKLQLNEEKTEVMI
ncbi:hypothetical protein NDU88_001844, partial [Pleurodeles waltl]